MTGQEWMQAICNNCFWLFVMLVPVSLWIDSSLLAFTCLFFTGLSGFVSCYGEV